MSSVAERLLMTVAILIFSGSCSLVGGGAAEEALAANAAAPAAKGSLRSSLRSTEVFSDDSFISASPIQSKRSVHRAGAGLASMMVADA